MVSNVTTHTVCEFWRIIFDDINIRSTVESVLPPSCVWSTWCFCTNRLKNADTAYKYVYSDAILLSAACLLGSNAMALAFVKHSSPHSVVA